jgi:hypothetical protein
VATKALQGYFNCKLKTPEKFAGSYPDSRALIISSGESTSRILKYRSSLKGKFDVVICVNYSFREFDAVSDFHTVVERQKSTDPITVPGAINEKKYRSDIPRLINWQGAELYNPKHNLYKTTRSNFNFAPDIRKYRHNNSEGLLYWKQKSRGWSSGTATLSSMHFATILGASEVYLIGADLYFKSGYDHYYKDKVYRDPNFTKKVQPKHRMDIVETKLRGRKVKTTNLFRDGAETLNELIPTVFKDVKVFDFSDGLITTAVPLDIDEFMKS